MFIINYQPNEVQSGSRICSKNYPQKNWGGYVVVFLTVTLENTQDSIITMFCLAWKRFQHLHTHPELDRSSASVSTNKQIVSVMHVTYLNMIISKDTILNDRICMNVFFSVRRMTIQIMKAIKEYFSLIFCPFAMIQVNSKVVFYPQDHFGGLLTGAEPAPKGQIGFHCGLL